MRWEGSLTGRAYRQPGLVVDPDVIPDVDPVVDEPGIGDGVAQATVGSGVVRHGAVAVRRVAADEVRRVVHALGVVARGLQIELVVARDRGSRRGAGGDGEGVLG